MKIQQENTDQLNAVLTITVQPEDYLTAYEKSLREYGKKASLPGFRPGKVPATLLKKRFGKSLLAEEINKIINEAITAHIRENELDVLGNPLPRGNEDGGDWDNPGEFVFSYDLGLAPKFEISLTKKDKHNFHLIKVDDAMIDKQISDMARRYGKISMPGVSEDNDLLVVDLEELDADGNPAEEGNKATSTISLEFIKDEETKKKLIGLKEGDSIDADPKKLVSDEHDLMKMLNLTHEELHELKSQYRVTVKEVRRLSPAEVNQELFDKIFGKDAVQDEAQFRAKIAEQLRNNFVNESDRLFKRDITEHLIKSANIELPDDFLRRWIMASNERPITHEQLEHDYPNYAKGLKWQLIENKIFREGNLKVENEDLISEAKAIMADQFARYGMPLTDETILEQSAHRLLSNRDEMRYVYEQVTNRKIMQYIKENIEIVEKEVSFDDFVKLANNSEN